MLTEYTHRIVISVKAIGGVNFKNNDVEFNGAFFLGKNNQSRKVQYYFLFLLILSEFFSWAENLYKIQFTL